MSAALQVQASADGRQDRRESDAAFVLSLRARGIFDISVLRAMEIVPREAFAPRRFADLARSDVALPLSCGQTMTAPAVVAVMLAALGVESGHQVLEIGTGSGYVSAILGALGGAVHTVERRAILAESAWSRLAAAGFARTVRVECADGFSPAIDGRYDRILVNGTVPQVASVLTSRLRSGGRLVCAMPSAGLPRLMTVTRGADGPLGHVLGAAVRIPALVVDAH